MEPTAQLAQLIAHFDGASVPPEVRHRARQCILDFLGVEPFAEKIAWVHLACHPLVLELTGKTDPKVGLEGKFSVYHCIAAGMIDGHVGPRSFTDEAVVRPEVRALRQLVRAEAKEGVAGLAQDQAELTVRTRSGVTLHHRVEHATGTLDNPMTDEQLQEKLKMLLDGRGRGDDGLAGRLTAAVGGIETVGDVVDLLALCR